MRLRLRTVRGRTPQRSSSSPPNQRVPTTGNIFIPCSRSSIISPIQSTTTAYPRVLHQARTLPPSYPHRKLRKQHTKMGSRDIAITLHTNLPSDTSIISSLLLSTARNMLHRRDAPEMLAAFTSPLLSVYNHSIKTNWYPATSTAEIPKLFGPSSPVK